MVNITYTETSSDTIYTPDNGGDPVIYNAGDMAFSEFLIAARVHSPPVSR